MYSHGAAADEQMMAHYYSELHRVYTDRYGTVWSQALPSSGAPDEPRREGLPEGVSERQSSGHFEHK